MWSYKSPERLRVQLRGQLRECLAQTRKEKEGTEGGKEGGKVQSQEQKGVSFCPLLPQNTQPKGLHSKYSILIYFTSFLSKKRNRTDCHGKKSLILTKLFPLGNTPLRESGKEKQED